MAWDDRRRRAKFPDGKNKFVERIAIWDGDGDKIVLADTLQIQGMRSSSGELVQFLPIEHIFAVSDTPAARTLTTGLICRHIAECQYWHLPLLFGRRRRAITGG